jgi:hypothetical protein
MNRVLYVWVAVALGSMVSATAIAGNIVSNSYAWSENAGWINFASGSADVTVSSASISGFAWAENLGWINFGPMASGGVTNNGAGKLGGYAWSENAGWINFAPVVGGSPVGGVSIDPATGLFSGYAWGENVGWINFGPMASGGVKTTWGAANAPALQGAASRKAQGTAGTFDLPLAP